MTAGEGAACWPGVSLTPERTLPSEGASPSPGHLAPCVTGDGETGLFPGSQPAEAQPPQSLLPVSSTWAVVVAPLLLLPQKDKRQREGGRAQNVGGAVGRGAAVPRRTAHRGLASSAGGCKRRESTAAAPPTRPVPRAVPTAGLGTGSPETESLPGSLCGLNRCQGLHLSGQRDRRKLQANRV